jgi:uncharacterized protein (DUF2336 family)
MGVEDMSLDSSDLQKLKEGSSGPVRAEIAQKVATEFAAGQFSEGEKRIAAEIFRLLVNDAEIQVRKILSEHLSVSMDAPHDVILGLARDVAEVALPVLESSYVLSEDDLIAITQSTQDVVIMSAIARRDMVSRELSETLLNKSNIAVVEILLRNKSATIDEKALSGIYASCGEHESILELMVRRGGLPVTLAEKIFVAVSDEMKHVLTGQYKLSVQMADDTIKDARELATLGLLETEIQTMDIAKLINQLYQQGRLTLSIIIRSLCLGDMRFFEHAMARLADVPVMNAQILVLDDAEGFASLYKTSCLPMELYSATRYLLKIALEETSYGRFQRTDFKQRLANRLAQDENAGKIEYMDYLLTLIQKNARDPATA